MATRSSEASTLNSTLATLATDVSAYLAAGAGDHFEVRQAVFNAIIGRLTPILGPVQYFTLSGGGTNTVPDQVHEDEVS